MAVHVELSKIPQKDKHVIKKFLCMQPKKMDFSKRARYAKPKDPVNFYVIDPSRDNCILPYTMGNSISKYNVNASRKYPTSIYNFTGTLWEDQVKVVGDALKYMKEQGTVTLGLYPGFGKTILSAYLASQQDGIVIVLFTRTSLQVQWKETFTKYTNAKCWTVDEEDMPSGFNVILCMNTRIHKIPPSILSAIKCTIIDEAHLFCTPGNVCVLLATQPMYIIACSATLNKRKDGMQSMIHAMCGKHGVFKTSTKPFVVYKLLTGITVELQKTKQGDTNWPQLVTDLVNHPLRNEYIIDLVKRNSTYKIIVLTLSRPHAFYLAEELQKQGVSADVLAGTKKMYYDSQVLVGTLSKIGTGFDEATFCKDFKGRKSDMMILCGSTKDEGSLEQFTGRVFRADFPTIIDLVDDNHICKNHWRERKNWYYERGGKIQVYEMLPDPNTNMVYFNKRKTDDDDDITKVLSQEKIKNINNAQINFLFSKKK